LKMPSVPEIFTPKGTQIPLVVILGPTAVGKTEIALQLAERLQGEIISADSRLFYRGMDIGTAKPSQSELARVPHHLVDITDPDDIIGLARFQRAARQAINDATNRGHLPFMVGGTGQYMRAVTEEWLVPRVQPHPAMREALENWSELIGPAGLHQRLAVLDPQAAEKIDYRNLRRTIRALEVILVTGGKFSAQKKRGTTPYHSLQLGLTLPRAELYQRIDSRVEAMLKAGLVEEVRSLLKKGYSPTLPSLSAIGYREIIDYLAGKIGLDEATLQIKRATRVLVRRQANWFKDLDPDIRWFQSGAQAAEAMEKDIISWLNELDKT
jgi:tRNA dimethylallyltransferase